MPRKYGIMSSGVLASMKIQVKEKATLFDVLRDEFRSASKTRVRKLIKHGAVTLGGILPP